MRRRSCRARASTYSQRCPSGEQVLIGHDLVVDTVSGSSITVLVSVADEVVVDRCRSVERRATRCPHRSWRAAGAVAAQRKRGDNHPLWRCVWRAFGKHANTVSLLLGVCTTRAGQTSTSWATSLAWSLSAGRSVVLVDCDMEGGTVADLLYLRLDDRGLANCFRGSTSDRRACWTHKRYGVPDRPGLRVIPGLRSTYGLEIGGLLAFDRSGDSRSGR